ncbi:MAG: hypothetical protein ABW133_19445 [Polyangiaceae bacterium]
MATLDPLQLDRDIARAVRAERAWWRTLRADPSRAADDAWYEPIRHVTTRTTFQEVESLSASDPLRDGLLAWMHRLALTRIAQKPILAVAALRHEANLRWDEPEPGIYSVRGVVRLVLTANAPLQARMWVDALARSAVPLLDREKTLRQAADEISSRLGVTDPSTFAPVDRATIVAEAEAFLRRTRDLASSLFDREHLADLALLFVARDVPGVWPTKPDARWLFDQFQGTPLLQGLTVDLGPTPSPLGGASFARALARLGAAYARVAVQGRAPFVVTTDPTEIHPLRRGALFASLAVDPVFLRKQLGFSRDAAGSTCRALAVTFLAALRLAAAQTVVDVANASATAIAEATEDALRVPVPPELSAVFPRIDPCASRRLTAALLAQSDADELRGNFDDDWFRNPRALAALREQDAATRPAKVASDVLRGAAEPLAKALEALAG